MRTLMLMRHAKSSWVDDTLPDEERPLNERGKAAALRMGRFLHDEQLDPDLILVSPAKRTRQTAKRLSEAGGFESRIVQNPRLYCSGPETYLDCIETVPNTVQILLVIGHNPDIEALVSRIAGKPLRMPTAAIARIHINGEDWRGIRNAAACTLDAVYRPKERVN